MGRFVFPLILTHVLHLSPPSHWVSTSSKALKVQTTAHLINNYPWEHRDDLQTQRRRKEWKTWRQSTAGGESTDRKPGLITILEKEEIKTAHILQAAVGSELEGETQTFTELRPWLDTAQKKCCKSMADRNLLKCRTPRRRNVNTSGAKVHSRRLLKPLRCFPSMVPIGTNAS